MHRRIAIGLVLALLVALPATAQDFDKGMAAYKGNDYTTALREFRPLANQGHARAQTNLGDMYKFGLGVPQDYSKAMKWYRKAAEQGFSPAQFNLSLLYGEGQGVPQDYVQALMWINLAEASLPDSARGPAEMLSVFFASKLTPSQIAEAQKLAREWREKHKKK